MFLLMLKSSNKHTGCPRTLDPQAIIYLNKDIKIMPQTDRLVYTLNTRMLYAEIISFFSAMLLGCPV